MIETKKYKVFINKIETESAVVEVEAVHPDHAEDLARKMMDGGEVKFQHSALSFELNALEDKG